MVCSNCGKELLNNTKFCTECGNKIEMNEESILQTQTLDTDTQPVNEQLQTKEQMQIQNEKQQYQQNIEQKEENFVDRQPTLDSRYAIMSTGSYIGSIIIMMIPIIGWLIAIIWALGGTKNINKRNFARAIIVIAIIVIIIIVIIGFIFNMFFEMIKENLATQLGVELTDLNIDNLMKMLENGELPFEIPSNMVNEF